MLGQTARDTVRFLAGSRCPNEATRLGHLGYKRAHWTGDHTIDRGRRARFPEASRTLSSTDPRQEVGRQEPGRQLASRTPVCPAARNRYV